jgi:hypothetical protein
VQRGFGVEQGNLEGESRGDMFVRFDEEGRSEVQTANRDFDLGDFLGPRTCHSPFLRYVGCCLGGNLRLVVHQMIGHRLLSQGGCLDCGECWARRGIVAMAMLLECGLWVQCMGMAACLWRIGSQGRRH